MEVYLGFFMEIPVKVFDVNLLDNILSLEWDQIFLLLHQSTSVMTTLKDSDCLYKFKVLYDILVCNLKQVFFLCTITSLTILCRYYTEVNNKYYSHWSGRLMSSFIVMVYFILIHVLCFFSSYGGGRENHYT